MLHITVPSSGLITTPTDKSILQSIKSLKIINSQSLIPIKANVIKPNYPHKREYPFKSTGHRDDTGVVKSETENTSQAKEGTNLLESTTASHSFLHVAFTPLLRTPYKKPLFRQHADVPAETTSVT